MHDPAIGERRRVCLFGYVEHMQHHALWSPAEPLPHLHCWHQAGLLRQALHLAISNGSVAFGRVFGPQASHIHPHRITLTSTHTELVTPPTKLITTTTELITTDARPHEVDLLQLPRHTDTTGMKNVLGAFERVLNENRNPLETPAVVDYHSSSGTLKYNASPCLTSSRTQSGGHWLLHRARVMSTDEMLRLQGLRPARWTRPAECPQFKFNFAIGNAMSGNVLELLFHEVLKATSLPQSTQPAQWMDPKVAVKKLWSK